MTPKLARSFASHWQIPSCAERGLKHHRVERAVSVALGLLGAAALGCSGSGSSAPAVVGGDSSLGGASATGGSANPGGVGGVGVGGTSSTGGSVSVGAGTGGSTGTGIGIGGTSSTGGSSGVGIGSTSSTGVSVGGKSSTGGSVSVGGSTGGSSAMGGKSSAGGSTATGGTITSVGGTAAGGKSSTGTGGSTGVGGTAAGGAKFCAVQSGAASTLLAFPGAQGFGKNATGARAGTVVHVTNLSDSGTGSFRDAVSASNRFVVFDVGGYIALKTAVSVKSNITIAGQTAPGGGIGFSGGEISFANQSNIIMRHVRIRPGSDTAATDDDALSLYRAKNVMIDHSSFEFAPWNNIDAVSDDWQNYPVTDITFQDCIIADPTGQQFGAHTESVSSQMAWYRNIFANSHNRNPLAKMNTVFVNNLNYNYSAAYTTHTSTTFKHDIVNNYFVMGPASTGTDNTWFQIDQNQSIYTSGNLKDTNLNGTLDGTATTPYWYQGTGTVLTSAWSTETTAVTPLSTISAARIDLSKAGPLPRDPLDALIISQVMTLGKGTTGAGANTVGPGSALYTSQAETGLANNGYGTIASGTKPTDTDTDGMPDNWEKANGSNVNSNDAMTKGADGYALIEQYVNWLAEPHATTTAGTYVDVDLSAYTTGFSGVSPTFTVTGAQNGTVTLQTDGHTARFQPTASCYGLGSFSFTVKGSDGATYTDDVGVLVVP